jgi:hypothetical protein
VGAPLMSEFVEWGDYLELSDKLRKSIM